MSKKAKAIIGILVLLIALLVGVIFYYMTKEVVPKEPEPLPPTPEPVIEEVVEEEPVEEIVVEEPPHIPTIDDVEDPYDVDSYTYEEIDEEQYFAAKGAVVRKLPWDEGQSIGTLSLDKTVIVYARCIETGYLKIKTNGGFYYVSGDELSKEYFPIELPLPETIKQPTKEKDALFIGNSITLHYAADFWWGDSWGMGATSPGRDYVHQVASAMGYKKYDIMSMRDWEMKDTRNKYLKYLDNYVTRYDYQTIIIFLGENARGHGHLGGDLVSMAEYIRAFNPDAQFVIVDNFWKYDDIIEEKKQAAEEIGAIHVSLEELWDVYSYQLHQGEVLDINGVQYVVDPFVAGHPNNKGMAAIAEKIVEALQENQEWKVEESSTSESETP